MPTFSWVDRNAFATHDMAQECATCYVERTLGRIEAKPCRSASFQTQSYVPKMSASHTIKCKINEEDLHKGK